MHWMEFEANSCFAVHGCRMLADSMGFEASSCFEVRGRMMLVHSTDLEANSCFEVHGCTTMAHSMGFEASNRFAARGCMMEVHSMEPEASSCFAVRGRMTLAHSMGLEVSICFGQVLNTNANQNHKLIAVKLPAEVRSHFVQVRYMHVLVLIRASMRLLLAVVRNFFEEEYYSSAALIVGKTVAMAPRSLVSMPVQNCMELRNCSMALASRAQSMMYAQSRDCYSSLAAE